MKIGGTPFEKIAIGESINIFAKLESYNFSGSVKDRMAHYMLVEAFNNGRIRKGDTIVEATTGNTGIAFSALARNFGLKMIAVMPGNQSIERVKLMQAYGAEVILTPAAEGPKGAIEKRDFLKNTMRNSWVPYQFTNPANVESHKYGLGLELIKDLQNYAIKPDYLVHGIGTGGTLMGVAEVLTSIYPEIKIVAVEPDEVPALSRKSAVSGTHGIQGIGEGFIPKIVDMKKIDVVERVATLDAIQEMALVIKKTGISMGISSGANIAAIRQILSRLQRLHHSNSTSANSNATFITIFADGIDRYLSLVE